MNRILAIVVTYNRKELLRECLDSLLAQQFCQFDIMVVDNASTDGTEALCGEYLNSSKSIPLIYENTGANLGGAGGFQYGLKKGVEKGYDYFWIMDDDTIPWPDALEQIWKSHCELDGNYGYLSSVALWTDGSMCKMNLPGIMGDFEYADYLSIKDGRLPIDWATFVSMFVKRSVVEEVGLPIKEFFIWCDDLEYTRRIGSKYKGYMVLKSKVIHKMKVNVETDISVDNERIERYYYQYRNFSYVAKKSGLMWKLLQFYRFFGFIGNVILKSKDRKWKRIRTIIKGFWDGIWFNPKVEFVRNDGKK